MIWCLALPANCAFSLSLYPVGQRVRTGLSPEFLGLMGDSLDRVT